VTAVPDRWMAVELTLPHYPVAYFSDGASHTPPFNGEVKNCWKCTASTALCIDGWILDQFSVI